MKQEETALLWKYVDGQCNHSEQEWILKMVANDPVWKQELESVQAANKFIASNLSLQQPSAQFAQQVMTKIQRTSVKKPFINKWVVKGIAAFFVITIISCSTYMIQHGSSFPNKFSYSFDISKYTSILIRTFLFANIIAILLLLDTLLRRRMKSY